MTWWRKPLIAAIVFGVFFGLYVLDSWWVGRSREIKRIKERAFPVAEEDVVKVSLITPDEIITVEKADPEARVIEARWEMTQPLETRADADAIQVMLSSVLGALRYGEFKVDSTINVEDYGLDEVTYTMKVTDKDGKTYTLLVGDQAAQSGKFYAKLENEARIFSINEYIKDKLDKKPFDFRDRTVLHVSVDGVKRVRMTRAIQMPIEVVATNTDGTTETTTGYERKPPEEIVIARTDRGEWKLEAPVEWKGDDIEIENMLRRLRTEKLAEFYDEPSSPPVDYGFEKPQIELEIEQFVKADDTGATATAAATATSPTETLVLTVGDRVGTGTEKTYFAKRSEGPVVAIGSSLFDGLAIKASKLRDKEMFTLDPDDVAHVEFVARRGVSRVELDKRDDGTWVFSDDAATSVDQQIVRDTIASLLDLRARDFETDSPEDLSQYKLDTPYVRVTVSNADRTTTEGISVGDLATRDEESVVFARRIGHPSVVLLDFLKPMELGMTKESLKDKSLFAFDYKDVARSEGSRGGTTFTLTRSGNTWRIDKAGLEKPKQVSAFTAEDVARGVAELKYDMIYEGGQRTAEQMGLTSPTLAVVLYGQGDAEIARVTRGIERGGRYYTRLQSEGPVYGVESMEFVTLDSAVDELLKEDE